MSVRRVYNLLVDGDSVYSGTYASVLSCYHAVIHTLNLLSCLSEHTVTIAFSPDV